ncbi:MAG TPA: PorV/PorQ family protein [Verrucomicrobiae bacterium]|nr:PorV/PorQ family protein [Verrucomicrobiae bacterium]
MKAAVLAMFLFMAFSIAKATKYAGEFLSLGVGARGLGMGGAYVAVVDDATSGWWNPAGAARLSARQAVFMHAETFGSLLNHDYLALGLPKENYGLVFSGVRLGGGGIKVTELPNPDSLVGDRNRPYVAKVEGHGDYAVIATYGRPYRENLFWGGSVKIIYRAIADNSAFGLGADAGLLWQPKTNWWVGAAAIDFTGTFLAYDTGTKETITPTLKLGTSYVYPYREFSFLGAFSTDLRFEGRKASAQYYQGSISADNHYGLEIGYRQKGFARFGFDAGDFTAGAGVWIAPLRIDFAFLTHPALDNSYRVSLSADF